MKIKPELFCNRVLKQHGKQGQDACEIMAASINAVDPYLSVKEHMLGIDRLFSLENYHRAFLIGFGKASVPMAKAIIDKHGDKLVFAKVITKDKKFKVDDGHKGKLQVYFGGHPVLTTESVKSTRAIFSSLPALIKSDLVLIVISGGGSALFTDPIEGISIADLQKLTEELLNCGADINEINTLRKHLDRVKGGRLALRLKPAQVFTFILSDVIGNYVDMIASGPTVPDPTTFSDAVKIIKKYELSEKLPETILNSFNEGIQGTINETMKPSDLPDKRLHNVIVGSNIQALQAAKKRAERLGYQSLIVSDHLTGSTESAGEFILDSMQSIILDNQPMLMPFCLIFGGETTVKVTGGGRGGRNQDLALRLVSKLAKHPGVIFVSLATDGEDGPTNAAGAVTDSLIYREGMVKGLDPDTFIKANNSYEYYDRMDGLIKIGATGTNVNDLMMVLVNSPTQD
ncbi:MAG: glycerate kinase [Chloroflexota bacterium]|nr:glycerate kinase [Chloroflexota bacterium]